MKKLIKFLKLLGKSVLAFILISLIFWTICLGILQTQTGQKWVFKQLIDYVEQKTHTQIKVKNIHFSFPVKFDIEELKIYQNEQLLLTLNSARIIGSYPRLIEGRFVLSHLKAEHLHIFDLPKLKFQPINSSDSRTWDETFLPIYLKVEDVQIKNITLHRNFTKHLSLPEEVQSFAESSVFNLQGNLSHNPFKSAMSIYLIVTSHDNQQLRAPIQLIIDAYYHHLNLTLETSRFPLPLNNLFVIPCLFDIKAEAKGPSRDWQYFFTDSREKNLNITGFFDASCHPLEEIPQLPFLNEQPTTLSFDFDVHSQNAFSILKFKSKNSYFQIEAKGTITEKQKIQKTSFKGSFHHLKHLEKWLGLTLEGNLKFDGNFIGTVANPVLNLNLRSPIFSIDKHTFQHIFSSMSVKRENENFSGFINLKMDYENHPWQFATAFNIDSFLNLKIHHLHFDALQTYAEGSLACSLTNFKSEGILKVHTNNLEEVSKFFSYPTFGKANFIADFKVFQPDNEEFSQICAITFHANEILNDLLNVKELNSHIVVKRKQRADSKIEINTDSELTEMGFQGIQTRSFKHQSSSLLDYKQKVILNSINEWQFANVETPWGLLGNGKGKLYVENFLQDHQEGKITFAFEDLQNQEHYIEKLNGESTLFFQTKNNPFTFSIDAPSKEAFLLDLNGVWSYEDQAIKGTISVLNGSWKNLPFHLENPLNFYKNRDQSSFENLSFAWNEAVLQASFNQQNNTFETLFSTNQIPVENMKLIFPELPIKGFTTFKGKFGGDLEDPKGQIELDLKQLQINEEILSKNLSVDGKVLIDFDANETRIKGDLVGLDRQPFKISGIIPLSLNLSSFSLNVQEEKQIDFKIDAEGDLDPYLHLFYDGANLSSHAKLSLKIGGQLNSPQVFGSIDIRNGSFESLNTGASFRNIQGRLEGDGKLLRLTQFSAEDINQGSISAQGVIQLEPKQLFPFEFQINTSKIFIINADYASLSASGPLQLEGNSKSAKLSGTLTVDEATVRLEETIPREVKSVEITYINIPENQQKLAYQGTKENSAFINLDVKVELPQRVYIQGHHLTSEWEGLVTVNGTIDDPLFNGDMKIIRGEYDFNGKIFNLTQGNIHFGGSISKKTTLYIVASKEINNVSTSYQNQNTNFGSNSKSIDFLRADIIVKGLITKPVISFRSAPPLSQREILSYILFNRGISDNTADQGDELSQSFISLNSSEQTSSTTDFLSRLRNNIGIDRLDFASENDQNSEYSLQIGKYITENIFVSINKSINAAVNRIAIEANLKENFKVQAEVGDDSQVRTSLKWKKNY